MMRKYLQAVPAFACGESGASSCNKVARFDEVDGFGNVEIILNVFVGIDTLEDFRGIL